MSRRKVFKSSRASGIASLLCAGAIGCGNAPESTAHEEVGEARAPDVAAKFPVAWDLVQRFLRHERALEGRFIAETTELHRPDVDGVAYVEFALRNEDVAAGYIIVSTGAHDVPIVAWNDRGSPLAAHLASPSSDADDVRAQETRSGVARIFMTGLGAFVGERDDGSPVSTDPSMTRERWTLAKDQFVRARAASKIESANRAAQAWRRIAERSGALLPSGVTRATDDAASEQACFAGGGAGCLAAPEFAEEAARGADLMWPPNYAQFSAAFDNGSCKVGCVPNAFTQIAAWASHQAGDHRDGSVWGHPRMAYAFGGIEDLWAPPSYDTNLAGVATQFRKQLGTTCSGNEGMTSYFPYDRLSVLSGQLFNRTGAPLNTAGIYNAGWDTYARTIDNSLLAHIPVEINAMTDPWGNSAHAFVAWGYRSDEFGEAYRVNMGWDFHEPGEWVSKESVLSALTSSFTHGIDGSGIVVFSPQDLWRDHGPITTGAGASQCLDVADASGDDAALLGQEPCNDDDSQLWYLDRTDMSVPGWQIRNRKSGQCLVPDVTQDAAIVQGSCDSADPNTFWKIEKRGANVALKHQLSGRCLSHEANGGVAAHEGKVLTSDCNDTLDQLFDFAR